MEEVHRVLVFLWILWRTVLAQDKGTGCSVTLCDRNRKSLHCENSEILITNVTHWKTAETAVTAFQNFRRMCMGKRTPCDASSYCQNGGRLKVSYLCISEYVIEKRCTGEVRNISSSEGFIQSPQYPSPVFTKCQWRINIPQDSYITITIHDLETSDGSQCASGIQLKTTRNCVNYTLPSDTICKANSLSPLLACGSVTVSLVLSEKGLSKVRFWLSYKVNKFEDVPNDYLEDLASDCPEGTYAKITNRLPALEGYIQPEQPDEVTTNVTIQEKEIIQADMTEKTVFYIAVAVAAISLTGLVIVTAVCIRRQRTLKASGAAQGGRIPSRAHNASANRPLPPIFKNKPKQNGHVQDRPCLQDGYSRVADEIPYNSSQDSTRSPAYAEVDDNISPVVGRHVFRFGIHGDNRKYSSHSVENVYSELNDGKDVYYEISDNYVQQQSPGLTSSDHDQLLKGGKSVNKKQHSNSPKPEKNKRPISFEGPYSKCQASDSTRAVSKELSDSDGSLVLMDNEVYDQYQSAHV